MRYMGIDYGKVYTGIALSDDGGHMGFPRESILTTPRLIDDLEAFIKKENIEGVVFGVSSNNGIPNAIVQEVQAVASSLHEKTGVPVFFEDESFTTQEARHKVGKEGFLSRIRHKVSKGGRKDASAAALILSRFLEKQP